MQTLKILLDLAEQQKELATDFLNDAQKSSGKNENDFWKALCSGWQYLADKLNGNTGEHTNSIINMPLVAEQFALVFYLAGKKNKEIYTKNGLTKEGLRITFNYLSYYAKEHRLNWYYYPYNGKPLAISYEASPIKIYELYKVLSEQDFKRELKKKKPEQIAEFLNIHLKEFVRDGGEKADWVRHTKQFISLLSIEQRDSFYNWVELIDNQLPPKQSKNKIEEIIPKSFEELFYNPENAEPCLRILAELQPPIIDAANNYIGKGAKGVFPLWVKVLKSHKPNPLIKHYKDIVYKDLLNQRVKGLKLTNDASEFRKEYKRLNSANIELDIKALLSQYSQSGKLGK
jgi:hypothetical protein